MPPSRTICLDRPRLYGSPFPLSSWSQFINMSASQKTLAQGANLVNFLRGQRGQENFAQSDDTKLFRLRAGRLGDIVGSQPTFVPPPNANSPIPAIHCSSRRAASSIAPTCFT
jgi:Tfp pilus tip-associated adhesin PilY1